VIGTFFAFIYDLYLFYEKTNQLIQKKEERNEKTA